MKKTETLNKAIWLFIVVLLILMPFGTFLIQTIKMIFEWIGVVLPSVVIKLVYGWKEALLVLGLIMVLAKVLITKKLPFKVYWFDIIIVFIGALGLLYGGSLVGGRIDRIVFGFRYDFLVFLFYFLARSIPIQKEGLQKMIKVVTYISLPIMLFGIAQTFFLPKGFMENFGYSLADSITGNPLPPYHLVGDIVRAMSTFPGPNSLAMYLVVVFLIVLFLSKDFLNKRGQYFFGAAIIFTLITTFSRGHIFSLLAALAFTVVIAVLGRRKHFKIKNHQLSFPLLATLSVVVLSVMIFFGTFWLADFSKNQSSWLGQIVLRETSTGAHSFMRELALDPIRQQPWGHGIGTAGMATTNIADAKFNPESWPIQLAFEYGIIGLIFFIIITFSVFQLLWRLVRSDDSGVRQKQWWLFFTTSFFAIIISTNFLPSWFEVGSLMWWIILGLYVSRGERQIKK